MIHEPTEKIDKRHKKARSTYFLLKARSIFNRVRYLSLLVALYVLCEYKIVTAQGAHGKWWQFAVFYIIDISFFYLNCYFVYPSAYQQRKTIYKPFLFIVLSLSLHYLFTISAFGIMLSGTRSFLETLTPDVLKLFPLRTLIVAVLSAVPFAFITIRKMLKREKILENNALYARISPHLIFNSLNFIHSDVRNSSGKAEKMIEYVSEYARYAMAELAEDGKAHLDVELAKLDLLIKINELRFEKLNLVLKVDLSKPVESYRIPPSAILSLAENIFKYGITDDPLKPIIIEVFDEPRLLYIRMFNWKAGEEGVISHKLGLDNLRKRLNNIYDHFFTMKIEETPDSFAVNLILPV